MLSEGSAVLLSRHGASLASKPESFGFGRTFTDMTACPLPGHADNPSFRYDFEADCGVKPFDDLDFPGACSSSGCRRPWSQVAAVSKNLFDEGEQAAGAPVEHERDAFAILNVGGMNGNAQQ